jgi:G3E family GTPase
MCLLLIAGFLGTGKTTLLLHVAHHLVSLSKSVVVIENEIGDIGIDGLFLKKNGLEVRELYGGCVCCTMRTDLRNTLLHVKKTWNPDYVLVEPTGAAYPGDVIQNLLTDVTCITSCRVVVLVDPVRYDMLKTMMTPMLDAQLHAATVVAINRIDEVDEETLEKVRTEVTKHMEEMENQKPVIPVSAQKQINLDELLAELL